MIFMKTHQDYCEAKNKLYKLVERQNLHLQTFDRDTLEKLAYEQTAPEHRRPEQSLARKCVNYLRHHCSNYDKILNMLEHPGGLLLDKLARHIRHVEKRTLVALLKKHVLDEITEIYPWLAQECQIQKSRDGVEDDPGQFIMPFGPYRKMMLKDIDCDYLVRLLGQSWVKKSYRTRIERVVAQRLEQAEAAVEA